MTTELDTFEVAIERGNPAHAAMAAALVGPLLFSIWAIAVFGIAEPALFDPLSISEYVYFLLTLVLALVLPMAIALPISGTCAVIGVTLLSHAEERNSTFRNPLVWIASGTIVAAFPAFAMFDWDFFSPAKYLVLGSGALGALVAWLIYFRKFPQISSRNSSSTAR